MHGEYHEFYAVRVYLRSIRISLVLRQLPLLNKNRSTINLLYIFEYQPSYSTYNQDSPLVDLACHY